MLVNRNKGLTSATAFIDIAKAFNCINHTLLLKKMKSMGFPDSFLSLLESYLAERKQIVKLNGYVSEAKVVIDGVPQGSNLGPTLFLIYMNDLMYVNFRGFLNLFADDSCLTVTGGNAKDIGDSLNHDLGLFSHWCDRNKLTINASKTMVVVFRSSKKIDFKLDSIYLNNEIVQIVSEYTYLGFVLDENLTFVSHINRLINSSTVKVFTLSKIRRYINSETAVVIFKSFILPRLEYGDVFCCGVPKKLLYKIQIVMNKALRICYRSKREDSNYHNHLKAKVMPLHLRRKCSILRLMHSVVSNRGTVDENTQSQSSYRQTRASKYPKLACEFPKTESFRRSISYTGPQYWERLPGRLKCIPILKSFKQEIKDKGVLSGLIF